MSHTADRPTPIATGARDLPALIPDTVIAVQANRPWASAWRGARTVFGLDEVGRPVGPEG